VVTLPAGCTTEHTAAAAGPALLYRVCDTPLLDYLGVTPTTPRFAPTRYDAATSSARLAEVERHPDAADRSRVSILLGNAAHPQTLTATHTLWAMLGVLPVGRVQRPHRHQSVALDLITSCSPGCYTLVGTEVDGAGRIVDPVRVDWESAGAFVTPPGLWHSHHNESGEPAYLLPIQDAGLHTYLRSLDIRFTAQGR
jgi:gentisate 1,2-dioxygenase